MNLRNPSGTSAWLDAEMEDVVADEMHKAAKRAMAVFGNTHTVTAQNAMVPVEAQLKYLAGVVGRLLSESRLDPEEILENVLQCYDWEIDDRTEEEIYRSQVEPKE